MCCLRFEEHLTPLGFPEYALAARPVAGAHHP